MNIAIKAALFNALLFPGWGEIYLKKHKRGILIITSIIAGIFSMIWSIVQATKNILTVAPFEKGTITFASIIKLTIDSIKSLDRYYIFFTLFFMIMLWILSIIDAYLLGKKKWQKYRCPQKNQFNTFVISVLF